MENGHYTTEQIRTEIKRMLAAVIERDETEIDDTASFMDDLGVDSLMALEVMVSMGKKFRIEIPAEEFVKSRNVLEAVVMVQRYLPEHVSSAAIV